VDFVEGYDISLQSKVAGKLGHFTPKFFNSNGCIAVSLRKRFARSKALSSTLIK